MNPSTRKMKPVAATERWLYRRDGNDYGPISTDELLDAIAAKKVDLGTQVLPLLSKRWGPAAEHAMLRDFYEKCQIRWRAEAFDTEAEAQVRRLARARQRRRRLFSVVVVGVVVAAGLAGWIIWRLGQAQPLGLDRLARLPRLGALPALDSRQPVPPQVVLVTGTVVPVLSEPETYDTAGIAMEGDTPAGPTVTKLSFTEDGGVKGLSTTELQRVLDGARKNLNPCALEAAKRDKAFAGTRISFTVAPGHITAITVSDEVKHNAAFKACVKTALNRVSVPVYDGGDRHVTIPITIGR